LHTAGVRGIIFKLLLIFVDYIVDVHLDLVNLRKRVISHIVELYHIEHYMKKSYLYMWRRLKY